MKISIFQKMPLYLFFHPGLYLCSWFEEEKKISKDIKITFFNVIKCRRDTPLQRPRFTTLLPTITNTPRLLKIIKYIKNELPLCHHNPSNSPFCGAKYRLLKNSGGEGTRGSYKKRWRRISICPPILKNKNKIQKIKEDRKKGCAIFFSFDVSLYVISLLPRCWIPGCVLWLQPYFMAEVAQWAEFSRPFERGGCCDSMCDVFV